jgi:hypothetical protein
VAIATIIFTVVVLFYAKQTGTTGGEIRHTEIRAESSNTIDGINQNKEEEDD